MLWWGGTGGQEACCHLLLCCVTLCKKLTSLNPRRPLLLIPAPSYDNTLTMPPALTPGQAALGGSPPYSCPLSWVPLSQVLFGFVFYESLEGVLRWPPSLGTCD